MTAVYPQGILFRLATWPYELAGLLPVTRQATAANLLLHEDEWEQMECVAGERASEVQATLSQYQVFEAGHRAETGWRKAYLCQPGRRF